LKRSLRTIFLGKYSLLFLAFLFFGLSFVYNKLYTDRSSIAREVKLAEDYIDKQQRDFANFLQDTALLHRLVTEQETLEQFNRVANKSYATFLYTATDYGTVHMRFWSDQQAVPPNQLFAMADGDYFEHLSNGYYVISKRTFSLKTLTDKVMAFAMVPIRSQYFIETDYLPHEFAYSSTAEKRVLISDTITAFPVKSAAGKPYFYLDKKFTGAVPYNSKLTIFLKLAAILFLCLFLHLFTEAIYRRHGAWRAIGFHAGIIVVLRVASYFYPSWLNLRQFELFDPAIYGSNIIQRSLGDLLINAILFCWIVLYAWSKMRHVSNPAERFSKPVKIAAGLVSLCVLILSTFVLASVIRSIVADSKISFDVTDFGSLTRYTVFGFVVLACLSLAYYYCTQLLFRLIFPLFEGRTYLIYFAISAAGLIYLTARTGDPKVLFYLPVLIWLLIYTWLVNRQGLIFNRIRINIAGILFWIFVFSASISIIMLAENKQAEWERRKNFAEKLVVQTDPASERLLNIAMQYLDNDFLSANFHRFQDPVANKIIRDSILTVNYSGYLNKYDTRLYVYDSNRQAVNNEDPTPYDDFNTLLKVQSHQVNTNLPDLFYYETSFDKFIYITERQILDSGGSRIGSLFILSNPKKFSSDAIFPELFKKYKQNDPESSPIYSSAVYTNLRLVSPTNTYPFSTWIKPEQVPRQDQVFEKRVNGDYIELWHRAGSGDKVVVIARKRGTVIETITLFSYIFCSFLFLVAIVQFISLLLSTVIAGRGFKKFLQFNIRTQVHTTIIFVSVFSFAIIGISTISFFIGRSERNNIDKLSRTMKIMVGEMQKGFV
jgi:two-component system nitrogen regulation sensor histidine kinase NtrY